MSEVVIRQFLDAKGRRLKVGDPAPVESNDNMQAYRNLNLIAESVAEKPAKKPKKEAK